MHLIDMNSAYSKEHTDLYKVPDAVPPIHAVSSHVATDEGPSKFRSIFSDNLKPIATRGKKARGTL